MVETRRLPVPQTSPRGGNFAHFSTTLRRKAEREAKTSSNGGGEGVSPLAGGAEVVPTQGRGQI